MFRISIRYKLLFLMAFLIVGALTVNTLTSIDLFNKDKNAYIYKANSMLTQALAVEVEARLASDLKVMHLVASHISTKRKMKSRKKNAIRSILRNAADIVALTVYSFKSHKVLYRKYRRGFLKENQLERDFFKRLNEELPISYVDIKNQGMIFENATLLGGVPLLSVGLTSKSYGQNNNDLIIVARLKLNRFLNAFSKQGDYTTYLLDSSGRILVHPDIDKVIRNDDLTQIDFISRIVSSEIQTGAEEFKDRGIVQIAGYRRLGLGGLTVISQIPKEKAFLASRQLIDQSITFGLMVVFVALFLSIITSKSLLASLKKLHLATRKIGKGDYKISVKIPQKDEVGDLAHSINTMAVEILTQIEQTKAVTAQKEKVKSTFGRYLSPLIVEKVLKDPNAWSLEGERKNISMFFSDVRDFTTISEELSVKDLTHCLNLYMTKMTDILFGHQGTLERFLGDAIVALWGAPLDVENHAYQSVKAATAMLEAMPVLNQEFKKLNYPEFKIGIGINTGEVNVGNMGSEKIMSYTALGDNMNLAARLESLCKHYSSKLLISEFTLKSMGELSKYFIYRTIDYAQVKGKKTAVHILEVLDQTHHLYKDPTSINQFNEAFRLYENKSFNDSLKLFSEISKKYPFLCTPKALAKDNLQKR